MRLVDFEDYSPGKLHRNSFVGTCSNTLLNCTGMVRYVKINQYNTS